MDEDERQLGQACDRLRLAYASSTLGELHVGAEVCVCVVQSLLDAVDVFQNAMQHSVDFFGEL